MSKYLDKNNLFIVIFLGWLSLWLSLGITPNNLNYNFNKYVDIVNFFRVYTPLFFSFFFLFIISIKYFKLKINYKKKFTITNLFIIYFLFQVIGLCQNNLVEFNIQNLYLVILGFTVIEIIILNQFLDTNKNLKYLLYSGLIICILTSSYFFIFSFIDQKAYSFYEIFSISLRSYYDFNLDQKFILESITPRSTGISRAFGLINVLIIIYLIFSKKKIYFLYILSIIYTSLIWLLQSRGSILIFFTTTILIIYLTKKFNLKKKLLIFFYLIILPIILSEIFLFLGKTLNSNYNNSMSITKQIDEHTKLNRIINENTTSGRIEIWNEALKRFDKNKIFGYGPQGDRFLLSHSEIEKKFYNNSSNALIYSFLSGGYFGIIAMLLIYLNVLLKIYICLNKIKIFNNNNEITLKISVCYIIFFTTRSLFENSFSVFSIDFILFFLSGAYIENYLKKITTYKLKVLK
jgi:O-antigen ligase